MTTTELVPQTTPSQALDTTAPRPDQLRTAWLEQAGLSDNTRKAYGTDLQAYYHWLSGLPGQLHPLVANRLVVDQYARSLEAAGLSKSTQARRLASLSSFYDYCESLELVARNPVQRVSRPKVDQESHTQAPEGRELVALL
ncbi:MAG: site-specific integrase, partial [Actinomycetes bacterium]